MNTRFAHIIFSNIKFGESKAFVGWAVAVNSGGTFFFSPILGKWADWRGVKEAIFFSLVMMIGGNLLYAVSMNVWVLMTARFIVGCAAGTAGTTSIYLIISRHVWCLLLCCHIFICIVMCFAVFPLSQLRTGICISIVCYLRKGQNIGDGLEQCSWYSGLRARAR